MHPHIPRPRRKATCTDTAGVVRTVHGEFMRPFTARVNEKNRTESNGSALGPALEEPGALQQPSAVHISEGQTEVSLAPNTFP